MKVAALLAAAVLLLPAAAAAGPVLGLRAESGASTWRAGEAPDRTAGTLGVAFQAKLDERSPAWIVSGVQASEVGWAFDLLGIKLAPARNAAPFVEAAVGAAGFDGATRATLTVGAGLDLRFGPVFLEVAGRYRIFRDAPGLDLARDVTQASLAAGAGLIL